MHYEKISSWISNDAIIPARDEQLENPRQLSMITTQDGKKMRRTLFKLDGVLMQLMSDFDMTFKTYEDERYKALKALDLDEKQEKYEELRSAIAKALTEHDDYHSDEMFDIFAGDHPPPHSTAAEEEPDSYEKLTTAYHALEDVLGEYPHLQDAFDIVANVLDGLDTGDPMGRADESLKEDTST